MKFNYGIGKLGKNKTPKFIQLNEGVYFQTVEKKNGMTVVKTWFELNWDHAGVYLWLFNRWGFWLWTNNNYFKDDIEQ